MKKNKSIPKKLINNYMVTFFIMWVISTVIGTSILGYFSIFSPFIVASFLVYLFHIALYNNLSSKHNRILKNILIIIFPLSLTSFIYVLTVVTLKPILKEFTIVETTKGTCGDKRKKPVKYFNDFFSGKNTSQFTLERNNHRINWYPNEENYYKYNKGDSIKIKVKKNFLNMEIVVQKYIN